MLRTETNSLQHFDSAGIASFPAWEGPQQDVQSTGITSGGATSPPSTLRGMEPTAEGQSQGPASCCIRAHRDLLALQEGPSVLVMRVLLQPCPSYSSTATLSAFECHQLQKTLPGTILRPKPVWHLISGPQRGSGQCWYTKSWLSSGTRLQSRVRPPWSMCWCEECSPLPPPLAPLCPWPAEPMAMLAAHKNWTLFST